jgi:hypothetical protein
VSAGAHAVWQAVLRASAGHEGCCPAASARAAAAAATAPAELTRHTPKGALANDWFRWAAGADAPRRFLDKHRHCGEPACLIVYGLRCIVLHSQTRQLEHRDIRCRVPQCGPPLNEYSVTTHPPPLSRAASNPPPLSRAASKFIWTCCARHAADVRLLVSATRLLNIPLSKCTNYTSRH